LGVRTLSLIGLFIARSFRQPRREGKIGQLAQGRLIWKR
jgi:hypothetical protein